MSESNDAARLDELAFELEKAKTAEAAAKNRRLEIESVISEYFGVKEDGSLTHKGNYYKVTTSAGFSRTLDAEKWEQVKSRVSATIASKIVKTKLELDTRQLKSLQGLDPASYNIVAEAITTKPKKVSVKFERLEVK